jgi:hypothetical protein
MFGIKLPEGVSMKVAKLWLGLDVTLNHRPAASNAGTNLSKLVKLPEGVFA